MNKMEALKNLVESTLRILCLKLLTVLKFTLCSKKIPHTDNSVGEKPAVSILLLQSE